MEQPLGVLVAGHWHRKSFNLFLLLLGILFAPHHFSSFQFPDREMRDDDRTLVC